MRFAPRVACFALAAALAHGATPGNPMPAVWKEQRASFFYKGRTARYSCDGLRDKVRALLLDLGARRDVKIVAVGCGDHDRFHVNAASPSLSIDFSAPALPDAAGRPLSAGDMSAIDARFEAFMITTDTFRNMGVGDCELVEEFTRQILPRLVTRGVKRDIACSEDQQRNKFLVQGVVLKTLPRAGLR
jgi:hypothetical protein